MRASLTDRSLIGIAGPPVAPIRTTPGYSITAPATGTLIAVARGTALPTLGQRLLAFTINGSNYWFSRLNAVSGGGAFAASAVGSGLPALRTSGRTSDGGYYAAAAGSLPGVVGIGTAATGLAEQWTSGSFCGVIYNRVLTDYERAAVIRWLATTLP